MRYTMSPVHITTSEYKPRRIYFGSTLSLARRIRLITYSPWFRTTLDWILLDMRRCKYFHMASMSRQLQVRYYRFWFIKCIVVCLGPKVTFKVFDSFDDEPEEGL